MMRVELIYDADCPNAQLARSALMEAFNEAGLRPSWTEWDRASFESPPHARHYGSPTILVNGRDVAGAEPADGPGSCRIYDHRAGDLRGVPPVGGIVLALRGNRECTPSGQAKKGRGWWRFLAWVPGIGAVLLPIGACPACWPVYAGLLGSLGLGFLFESTYLLPVTVALLGLALFALAFRAHTRRGYGPLALGFASVCAVLAFKFLYVSPVPVYAGLLALVAASVWNAWPKRKGDTDPCPNCVRLGSETELP